jgi:hypothetical protein
VVERQVEPAVLVGAVPSVLFLLLRLEGRPHPEIVPCVRHPSRWHGTHPLL